MQAFLRFRRPLCLILLATQLLTACTSWQVETIPLTNRLRAEPPSSVRLWLADSSRMDLRDPRWVNDSVAGRLTASTPLDTTGTRALRKPITIPTSDVTRYATRQVSAGKTIGLVAGVVFGLIFVSYLACGDWCRE